MIRAEGSAEAMSPKEDIHLKELREAPRQVSRGRTFQGEVTASSKVLRQECVLLVLKEQGEQCGRGNRGEHRC